MPKISAGLLMYQKTPELKFFLVHPGGPYFKNKDLGSWTIPKGEPMAGEDLFSAAFREFKEETGITPTDPFVDLGSIKQAGGKTVFAWAFEFKESELPILVSNNFILEWPAKSGKMVEFPEIDKGDLFRYNEAIEKINPAQIPFIEKIKTTVEQQIINE